MLLLCGKRDRLIPPSVCRRIAARYGERVRYLELADHAHWPQVASGWEAVAQTCQAFIEED